MGLLKKKLKNKATISALLLALSTNMGLAESKSADILNSGAQTNKASSEYMSGNLLPIYESYKYQLEAYKSESDFKIGFLIRAFESFQNNINTFLTLPNPTSQKELESSPLIDFIGTFGESYVNVKTACGAMSILKEKFEDFSLVNNKLTKALPNDMNPILINSIESEFNKELNNLNTEIIDFNQACEYFEKDIYEIYNASNKDSNDDGKRDDDVILLLKVTGIGDIGSDFRKKLNDHFQLIVVRAELIIKTAREIYQK